MKVLALDLGSMSGWASGINKQILKHGTQEWTRKQAAFTNESFVAFFKWLYPIAKNYNVIVVESPNAFMPGYHAYRVLFGMYGLVQLVCGAWKIECVRVSSTAVKKFWTGKGNARKEDMVAEAVKRGFVVKDDNNADALAIYTYYMEGLHGQAGLVTDEDA